MEKNALADGENDREPLHHDAKHEVLEILACGSNDMVLWVMQAAAEELKMRLDSATETQPTP